MIPNQKSEAVQRTGFQGSDTQGGGADPQEREDKILWTDDPWNAKNLFPDDVLTLVVQGLELWGSLPVICPCTVQTF